MKARIIKISAMRRARLKASCLNREGQDCSMPASRTQRGEEMDYRLTEKIKAAG
jgi:hypothetical protein